MTTALELLANRTSNGKLKEPAPDAETTRSILQDALRAPDHASLRPWKILELRGTEALTALGEVFADATRRADPNGPDEGVERMRRNPLRCPLMLVVAACPVAHPKIPEIEQILSAGAVAHGILLGLQARGFSGMWRTGPMAYDASVKAALGLRSEDHIVAFVYAGTAALTPPEGERPDAAAFVSTWPVR